MPSDRSPRRDRWFGSIRVSRDGGLRFSPWTFPGLNHVTFWVTEACVTVVSGGRQVLYLWLERTRAASACFVYDLTPDDLRDAVQELRGTRGGLERWIVPALESTQADLSGIESEDDPRRALVKVIPELLESCRDLPVAEPWQSRRRELRRMWAELLREHPEKAAKVPAPWLLPDGHMPARGTLAHKPAKRTSRKRRPT